MKNTAKDIVISVMLKETGLTLQEINQKVKKNANRPFSYHSVYKALNQHVEEGIIEKKGSMYYISENWAKEKINFAEKVKAHLKHMGKNSGIEQPSLLEFDDINELYKFLRRIEEEELAGFKDTGTTVTWTVYHYYNYLLKPAEELAYIKKLKERNIKVRILCYGNTSLDAWTKRGLEKIGTAMRINTKVGGMSQYHIYDDLVVQIFYNVEFFKVLQDVYKSTPNISEFDVTEFFEKLSKIHYKINVAIHREKNVATCLKERADGFFK